MHFRCLTGPHSLAGANNTCSSPNKVGIVLNEVFKRAHGRVCRIKGSKKILRMVDNGEIGGIVVDNGGIGGIVVDNDGTG